MATVDTRPDHYKVIDEVAESLFRRGNMLAGYAQEAVNWLPDGNPLLLAAAECADWMLEASQLLNSSSNGIVDERFKQAQEQTGLILQAALAGVLKNPKTKVG